VCTGHENFQQLCSSCLLWGVVKQEKKFTDVKTSPRLSSKTDRQGIG